MFRGFKSRMLLAVCCTLLSAPAWTSEQTDGQILGGSLNSPIRIEVFSDFQCPACRELYLGTIRQVLQEYSSKDKVCIIYHEFPLATHQYSQEAARYAEAASRLGVEKLLPVMDMLFTDQAQWSQDGKLEASVSKALSQEDFQKLKKIMQDPGINAEIQKQIQLGVTKEVKSTPTMFIYYPPNKQQKAEGLITYLVMKGFIDRVVK
jgi:protein-disulfide isomerase